MAEKYQRFGKYLILDHLVDGGMAKICIANYLGEQANKIVAIKMVQPQYSKNASFVQMFEDELKVTFGLLHPNIAQVYDYGMVDEQLYSAMEYVDGANLKQYLDRLKEMKFVFPVEISTYIVSQVSQALHYAHTFQDKLTGKPFNIIHRDISPHNIMLTYDGSVKLIDFGIAKADSNSEATQAGTIKGKLSYLAPEYLEGLELDHRYDQFAVGITLWEMLCSRKLFTAKNDLAVLKLIQGCKIPKPSSINPNVPAELDEIVLKALSKDRSQRFENMDKLNRALVKFLYSKYPDFNATDLSYFAKQLFKKEIESDHKKFVEFGKIDLKPFLSELQQDSGLSNSGGTSSHTSSARVQSEEKSGKIVLDLGTFDDNDESIPNLDLALEGGVGNKKKRSVTTPKLKTPGLDKMTPEEGLVGRGRTRVSEPTRTRTRTRVREANSNASKKRREKEKQDQNKGKGSYIPLFVVASLVGAFFFKPALIEDLTGLKLTNEKKREVASRNKDNYEPKPLGEVTINNLEPSMKVLVNGKVLEFSGISAKVPFNEKLNFSVTKSGYKKWEMKKAVILSDSRPFVSFTIPELEKLKVGYLTTSLNYSPGSKIKFEVDGKFVEKNLPLKNERIPAGQYSGTIHNPVLGTERRVKFTVEENKRNFLK